MPEPVVAAPPAAPRAALHLPGEPGVWVFILGDMFMFALFFVVFAYYRADDLPTFHAGQQTLNQAYGVVNTLLLLSSSWFVVLAVRRARAGASRHLPLLFALAGLCGLAFAVLKLAEYAEKVAAGLTLTRNDFYMYYFVLTGLHFVHVLIGLGVLVFLWHGVRVRPLNARHVNLIECGATYWHMVDALWIVLFPLLYLMK